MIKKNLLILLERYPIIVIEKVVAHAGPFRTYRFAVERSRASRMSPTAFFIFE